MIEPAYPRCMNPGRPAVLNYLSRNRDNTVVAMINDDRVYHRGRLLSGIAYGDVEVIMFRLEDIPLQNKIFVVENIYNGDLRITEHGIN